MSKTYEIKFEPGKEPQGGVEGWALQVGPFQIAPYPTPAGEEHRGPWMYITNTVTEEGMGTPVVEFLAKSSAQNRIVAAFLIDTLHRYWDKEF